MGKCADIQHPCVMGVPSLNPGSRLIIFNLKQYIFVLHFFFFLLLNNKKNSTKNPFDFSLHLERCTVTSSTVKDLVVSASFDLSKLKMLWHMCANSKYNSRFSLKLASLYNFSITFHCVSHHIQNDPFNYQKLVNMHVYSINI